MYALGILLYALVCGIVAWLLARPLTRRAAQPWARWAVTVALAPIVFLLPLADEIVGRLQFERLCEEANDVKIHGTIPVGEDLYTLDGKWRLDSLEGDFDHRMKEGFRLQKLANSYLGLEHRRLPDVQSPMTIWGEETRVIDAKNGRLLAVWRQYGTSGGWASRNFEVPIIVRPSCGPDFGQIKRTILKFSKPSDATK